MPGKDSSLRAEFIAQAYHSLLRHHLPRIERCVNMLSETEIWWRPNPESNSVGNLLLHLEGNVRQWIVSGLGGAPDSRQRDLEFSEAGPLPHAEILARLRKTVRRAARVVARLSTANLLRQYQIQRFRVTGLEAVFHVAEHFAFPSPAALAILSPRELQKIQISGPKARYIIAIARDVLDGRLDLEGLRAEEPAAAHARLLERKGIGPWTAFFVGLIALSHVDALPSGDVGLQSAIHAFYGLSRRPSPARVERLARNWSGWRSYATFYLWMTYWEMPEWRKEFIRQLKGDRDARKGFLAKS